MADITSINLKPNEHVALDQPLLRLPFELSRNTFRTAHRQIEQNQAKIDEQLKKALKDATTAAADGSSKSLESLDQALARLQALKQKLASLQDAQETYTAQSSARIDHLEELYQIPTLSDVKYDSWSQTRLNRLLVDYLVRKGYTESARALAADKQIENLVDVDEFESLTKIERSLRHGHKVDLALTWCGENKQTLKKMESTFEYALRMQQYVELVRTRNPDALVKAIQHARKYLASVPQWRMSIQSAGLLAFNSDTDVQPFQETFSNERWNQLADLFLETHHKIFSLPLQPMLHIALIAGLSALKTPACHSKFVSPTSGLNAASSPQTHKFDFSNDDDTDMLEESRVPRVHNSDAAVDYDFETSQSTTLLNTPVCPICSTELNQLAKTVPFAHHSKSNVESDPVVLPNGRVYGKARLMALNQKLGTTEGFVVDPLEPDKIFSWGQIQKIFIS